jgi:hypothetical protein
MSNSIDLYFAANSADRKKKIEEKIQFLLSRVLLPQIYKNKQLGELFMQLSGISEETSARKLKYLENFYDTGQKVFSLHPHFKTKFDRDLANFLPVNQKNLVSAKRTIEQKKKYAKYMLREALPSNLAIFIPYLSMYICEVRDGEIDEQNKFPINFVKTFDYDFFENAMKKDIIKGTGAGIQNVSFNKKYSRANITDFTEISVGFYFQSYKYFTEKVFKYNHTREGTVTVSYLDLIKTQSQRQKNYSLVIEYGWSVDPVAAKGFLPSDLIEYANRQEKKRVVVDYTGHDFKYNDDGSITLSVNYIGNQYKEMFYDSLSFSLSDINDKILNRFIKADPVVGKKIQKERAKIKRLREQLDGQKALLAALLKTKGQRSSKLKNLQKQMSRIKPKKTTVFGIDVSHPLTPEQAADQAKLQKETRAAKAAAGSTAKKEKDIRALIRKYQRQIRKSQGAISAQYSAAVIGVLREDGQVLNGKISSITTKDGFTNKLEINARPEQAAADRQAAALAGTDKKGKSYLPKEWKGLKKFLKKKPHVGKFSKEYKTEDIITYMHTRVPAFSGLKQSIKTDAAKAYEKNPKVAAQQSFLIQAGYLPAYSEKGKGKEAKLNIDGVAGTQTKAAIKKYQKDIGVPQTGQWDEATSKRTDSPGWIFASDTPAGFQQEAKAYKNIKKNKSAAAAIKDPSIIDFNKMSGNVYNKISAEAMVGATGKVVKKFMQPLKFPAKEVSFQFVTVKQLISVIYMLYKDVDKANAEGKKINLPPICFCNTLGLSSLGEEFWVNIGDVPIEMRMLTNFLKKKLTRSISAGDLIRAIFDELVPAALYPEVAPLKKVPVKLVPFSFNFKKWKSATARKKMGGGLGEAVAARNLLVSLTKGVSGVGPSNILDQFLEYFFFDNESSTNSIFLALAGNSSRYLGTELYLPRSILNSRRIFEDKNTDDLGIYKVVPAAGKGILKDISFNTDDIQQLRDATLVQKEGLDKEDLFISYIYGVTANFIGTNVFSGTGMFALSNLSLGVEADLDINLSGFYQIHQISDRISPRGYDTSIEAQQTLNTTEMQKATKRIFDIHANVAATRYLLSYFENSADDRIPDALEVGIKEAKKRS